MSGTTGVSSISGLAGAPTTSQVGPQANDAEMNQFLTLLTAELQNQDPTQPTDPTQFVAQLAQFSTVEQLVQGNTTLSTISQALSSQSLGQYASMIGDTVNATVSSVSVSSSSATSSMSYNVTTPSLQNIHAQITDASGNIVRTIPVTGTSGTLQFDGLDSSGNTLPAGIYGISLVGAASGGAAQTAGTLTGSGVVSSVTQGTTGGWQLQLQDGRSVDAASVTTLS
jgi:flagellar basal-body rod modification protein FlgD